MDTKSRIAVIKYAQISEPKQFYTNQMKLFLGSKAQSTNFISKLHTAFSGVTQHGSVSSSIHITWVLDGKDPRAHSPEMRKSIPAEIKDLIKGAHSR